MGDGRAEQGDDAVAEQLVDAAAEQLDVGDEPLEAGLDQTFDVLRVAVLGERGVPDEVGEQDRDDPALLERDRRRLPPDARTTGQNRAPDGTGWAHEAHATIAMRPNATAAVE